MVHQREREEREIINLINVNRSSGMSRSVHISRPSLYQRYEITVRLLRSHHQFLLRASKREGRGSNDQDINCEYFLLAHCTEKERKKKFFGINILLFSTSSDSSECAVASLRKKI